jgi:hypothetical protein
VVGPILDKLINLIPDPNAAQKARLEVEAALLSASIEEMKGQVAINTAEASSASVWVAGWRPAIGWSCALAFFFMYVLAPVVQWMGPIWGYNHIPMPQFNANDLMSLTMGMLGIAGFRTFEKVKGITK